MSALRGLVIGIAMLLPLLGSCARPHPHSVDAGHAEEQDQEGEGDHQHMGETVESMAPDREHIGPHFKWTAARTSHPDDRNRAERIAQVLRESLVKYKDYRVALKDGFEPFLPHIAQLRYHFTNKWHGFKGAFRFDPTEPTSLLYKKTADGYELVGAMYTAPKRMTEEKLNERVPLSVARWHAHVNICLPAKRDVATADWTRFGLKGTIAAEGECKAAGGRWHPQIFGWMLHVFPFEDAPEKIWTH